MIISIIITILVAIVLLLGLFLMILLGANLIDLGSEFIKSNNFIKGYFLIVAGLLLILFVLCFIIYIL